MKKITLLVVIILIAAFIVACGTSDIAEPTSDTIEASTDEEPVEAGDAEPVILRVGGLTDPGCWNPFVCSRAWDFADLVYEGFTGHGAGEGCPAVPRLAETWEQSDDGLTWTWHLYEGITYSDGVEFNAHTVVDFFNWWNSTELIWWYPESSEMESIEALDDYTIKITTTVPINNYPYQDAVWFYIMPPHIWGEFDDVGFAEFDSFPPIGTGPYVVTDYQPGSSIVFDAREDYYRGDLPVDRIVYQIYGNSDAAVNAYLAGDIDLINTNTNIPVQYYDVLSKAPNTTVEEAPPGDAYWLSFNMFNLDDSAIRHPAVNDPAVREAIDYAIDKQHIVDVALFGHGVTCPTNWACGPRNAADLNPDLVVTPFDLDKANSILNDAGYVDSDNDGVRETSDGVPLDFRLYFEVENAAAAIMATTVSEWLAEIGISVQVEGLEQGTLLKLVLGDRDFDMAIFFWSPDLEPTAWMSFQFACWSAEAGISGLNDSGYCNEDLDTLIYDSWYESDPKIAKEKIFKAQALVNQERPIIFLAGQNILQIYNNEKFGFPEYTCEVGLGTWNFPSVLDIEVK